MSDDKNTPTEPSDEPNAFELENIANDGKEGAYDAAMATFGPNEPDAAFKVMGEIRYWANRAIWRAGFRAGVATHNTVSREQIARELFRRLYPGSINTHDMNRTRESDLREADRAYEQWDHRTKDDMRHERCYDLADAVLAHLVPTSKAGEQ